MKFDSSQDILKKKLEIICKNKKVYCTNCLYYSSNNCNHKSNVMISSNYKEKLKNYRSEPKYINKNNDCKNHINCFNILLLAGFVLEILTPVILILNKIDIFKILIYILILAIIYVLVLWVCVWDKA
jgi:hypothetical protein